MNILPDGSAFDTVMTFSPYKTWWQKWKHYLFSCPTFWRWKPAFTCPECGATYRCYWDGNDAGGQINLCTPCTEKYQEGL
jgi:hypothetical protein